DGTTMTARGLLLDNGGGAGTVSKQVTIQNSTFVNVGPKDDGDCLVIQGSTDTDANLLITNNSFDYCYKRAIKLQVGGVNVVGNTVNNPFSGNNKYQVRQETTDPKTNKPTFDMFSAVGIFSSNVLGVWQHDHRHRQFLSRRRNRQHRRHTAELEHYPQFDQ